MPKRKTKTIAGLVDDCAKQLQRIVRMKAAIHKGSPYIDCVTCGKVDHWTQLQGGHYISRVYTAHKLLEENIHPQCKHCNQYDHKSHDDYGKYMREMYGHEFVDDLTATKRQTKKYNRVEITEILQDLKQQAKSLEQECELL